MSTTSKPTQALIKLSKLDLKVLLLTAALLPVLSFAAGLFTANSIAQPQAINMPVTMKTNATDAVITEQAALKEEINEAIANKPASPEIPLSSNDQFLIQAGVFSSLQNANSYRDSLLKADIEAEVLTDGINDKDIFRVILSKHETKQDAEAILQQYQAKHPPLKLYISLVTAPVNETIAAL
jgi:cell division septation protein DedD